MGMTWEQYWFGDVTMVRAYAEAERLRQQRQNGEAWLQGRYIYDALLCVAPVLQAFAAKGTRPEPYIDKPYEMAESQNSQDKPEMSKEEQERIQARIYMEQMFEAGKNWGKK